MALVELLRAMGSESLHLAFTCTGSGVTFTLMSEETGPVAGWGPTIEDALSNAYAVPKAEPLPAPPSRFRVVAGTDRRGPTT